MTGKGETGARGANGKGITLDEAKRIYGEDFLGVAQGAKRSNPNPSKTAAVHPFARAFGPPTPLDWPRMKAVKRRQWIYDGLLVRGYVSFIGGPGGAAKTTYAILVLLCVVSGRALLHADAVRQRVAVWFFCLEDPIDELLMRVDAAIIHHGVNREDIEGRLFLDSGRTTPLSVASLVNGTVQIHEDIVKAIIARIRERNIGVVCIDPVVKADELAENDNKHRDIVMTVWARIANEANCAVLLLSHFRKGGQIGEADSFRGGSATTDAARVAVTIAKMTADEAKRFGIDEEVWRYRRVDSAKENLAPPAENALWIRLASVLLENGENVQAAQIWTPPIVLGDISQSDELEMLEAIASGLGEGEHFTTTRSGKSNERWAGAVIMRKKGKSVEEAARVIQEWRRLQVLSSGQYVSPKQRKSISRCIVNLAYIKHLRERIQAAS